MSAKPMPMTAAEFKSWNGPEYILLMGHSNSGKSDAILCMAHYWRTVLQRQVYILDTEGGILKVWRSPLRPYHDAITPGDGVSYYRVSTVDEFVICLGETILPQVKKGDLLCVESVGRVWEHSQDIAYTVTTGMGKAEFLERRIAQFISLRTAGKEVSLGSPIADPDKFWQVAKHYNNRAFLDLFSPEPPCDVVLSTPLGPDRPRERQSKQRQEVKNFLGTNLVPDGSPRTAYYPDTIILMSEDSDGFHATVVKDRGLHKPGLQSVFDVRHFYLDLQVARRGLS